MIEILTMYLVILLVSDFDVEIIALCLLVSLYIHYAIGRGCRTVEDYER